MLAELLPTLDCVWVWIITNGNEYRIPLNQDFSIGDGIYHSRLDWKSGYPTLIHIPWDTITQVLSPDKKVLWIKEI